MKTYKDIVGDGGSGIVAQVVEQGNRLKARLASVQDVVAVVSGKGGVGKSVMTVNLAAALALSGRQVGILDADLNGPSVAKMAGVRGQQPVLGTAGVAPAVNTLGVKVMSMDLFLPEDGTPVVWEAPTQQDAYTWRGTVEAVALRELVADTAWEALDVLLIDLPPGTDRIATVLDIMPHISGFVIVTIPSEISQLIVAKSIEMSARIGAPVIGLVENMARHICAHCGEETALFPAGQVEALAARYGVPYLGDVPFDPRLGMAADTGTPFLMDHADTPAGRALQEVAVGVASYLTEKHAE